MSNHVKVTVLGGSAIGTPELVGALRRLSSGMLPLELALYGRAAERLEAVAGAAQQMAENCDWLHVTASTDLAVALTDADYVIIQVRIGGLEARAFDETFPIALGIPGDETVGPGGFANAWRTIPDVLKLAQAIADYAPNALILSFANPASLVQYAITCAFPDLRMIGLCDIPVIMVKQAAAAIGVLASKLVVDYVGMHHFGFITRVVCDGQDRTTQMLDNLERIPNLDMDFDFVRSLGALPSPYFRYFIHGDRLLERQWGQTQSRAQQLQTLERELLAEYAQGHSEGVSRRGAKWYDLIIGPVLVALMEKREGRFIINVRNENLHPWLPPDAIIETPCTVLDGQIYPLSVPAPHLGINARITMNCAYEQLTVESILEQSASKAIRALTMSPMVISVDRAHAVWRVMRSFAAEQVK